MPRQPDLEIYYVNDNKTNYFTPCVYVHGVKLKVYQLHVESLEV